MVLTYDLVPDLVRGVIDNKCRERWLTVRQHMQEAEWTKYEQNQPRKEGHHWQDFTATLEDIPVPVRPKKSRAG